MLRCVEGRGARVGAFALGLFAAAALTLGGIADAEARGRRKVRAAGYAPPHAAIVVDAKTGRVLSATNEHEPRYPASVTKVMTLYMLFEQMERGRFHTDSELRVSARAQSQAPSKIGVRAGSTIEVEDAIKALVTKSANDVAVVVAENVAGSEEAFAEAMTSRARTLGMTRTTFRNASGLPDPEQVTTAHDLAILGRAIQERFPRYYTYFQTASFQWGRGSYRNHNKLLGRVEGVDGIKTGYTRASGFNLLTSAKLGGRQIVAVVMGGRSGAARDAQMARLVVANLDRASAGPRTSNVLVASRDTRTDVGLEDDEPRNAPARRAVREPAPRETVVPVAVASRVIPMPEPRRAEIASASPFAATTVEPPRGASVIPSAPLALGFASTARPAVTTADSGRAPTPPAAIAIASATPSTLPARPAREVARAPEPPKPAPVVVAAAPTPPAREPTTTASVPRAGAAPAPRANAWIIQLGATDEKAKADAILAKAKTALRALAKAEPVTERIEKGGSTLWRARFTGFDADDAQAHCKSLVRNGFACFATRG